jgi:hypothetical protein
MDLNAQKEQFSNAFIYAVASAAGCSVAKPSVDHDSIDWTISNRLPRRPKLDIQLKSTANDGTFGAVFPFSLKRKNYDDLRITDLIAPRILIVVLLPTQSDNWIKASPEELILRRCAYWISLAGLPESTNEASISIEVPSSQAFTVQSLNELMQKTDQRQPL